MTLASKKLLQRATIPSGSSYCIFIGRVPKLKRFYYPISIFIYFFLNFLSPQKGLLETGFNGAHAITTNNLNPFQLPTYNTVFK